MDGVGRGKGAYLLCIQGVTASFLTLSILKDLKKQLVGKAVHSPRARESPCQLEEIIQS